MKCPVCYERTMVELNTHSDGYVSNGDDLKECGHCGSVWVKKANGEVQIIKNGLEEKDISAA